MISGYFCNFEENLHILNHMKRQLIASLLLCCVLGALACTSAIVSGRLTANGRPLLWKNRDTDDQNNKVERIAASRGCYEYVALFNATDTANADAWMGFNKQGFAIMNTASYNVNSDTVKHMDQEGRLMALALKKCATVADFQRLLDSLPRPLHVEANFGVIDAQGHGAYFETGNFKYVKYDLAGEPSGILTRTNYSYSGRPDKGMGYIREQNEKHLLARHIAKADITPAVFTEELSRTFYHSLLGEDFTGSGRDYVVDQDFIPRRISTATVVIEGVLPGEDPILTTMWTGLGYSPCSEIRPVWLWPGGLADELRGIAPRGHSPLADKAQARKRQVFDVTRGNGKHYVRLSCLYNREGTGFCQTLIPLNMAAYAAGYAQIEQHRAALAKQGKAGKRRAKR